ATFRFTNFVFVLEERHSVRQRLELLSSSSHLICITSSSSHICNERRSRSLVFHNSFVVKFHQFRQLERSSLESFPALNQYVELEDTSVITRLRNRIFHQVLTITTEDNIHEFLDVVLTDERQVIDERLVVQNGIMFARAMFERLRLNLKRRICTVFPVIT